MTKKEALAIAIETVTDEEAVAVLKNMVTQLEKRSSATRKPTKAQIENEAVKGRILEMMTAEGVQCKAIAEALGITGQKCSALLTQLVKAGEVEKYTEKRVTYFRGVGA